MPNKKSAEKRIRQSLKRRMENRSVKSEIKTCYKRIIASMENKNKEEISNLFNKYQSLCDKAVKRNIIHKNTAARYKARASKLVSNI